MNQLFLGRDEKNQGRAIAEFKELVGPIALLADPLSARSLSSLLEIPLRDIGERLSHLHSVLDVPTVATDRDAPVRLLHLSFRDFLVDRENDATRFWIDSVQTHRRLAQQCAQRLNRSGTLLKDLCNLRKPGSQRASVNKQRVADSINADVAYACHYWVWHLAEGEEEIVDNGFVHQFLKSHLLHWLEALSWLGRLSSAVDSICTLQSLVKASRLFEISQINANNIMRLGSRRSSAA